MKAYKPESFGVMLDVSRNAVMSIPAFILFKDGKEVSRTVGYMSKDELLSELNLQ